MPEYEGIVASLMADGKAEVVIRPGSPGIPGAPSQVNRRVCHCTTDGSSLTVEARNSVGASVGDLVLVTLNSSALFRNIAAVVGAPLAGLAAGIAFALLVTHGFTANINVGLLFSAAGLVLGIIVGVLIFRRFSTENMPVMGRIIMTRLEAASRFNDDPSAFQDGRKNCQGCTGTVF